MMPINRENLRDAAIAIAIGLVLAWALSACATAPQPPPSPTAAQLAPAPQPTAAPAPRITGATILAEQPPEVQQAIKHGQPWLTFKWPRERLIPYTTHASPLSLDLAPYQDIDVALQQGESIDGVSLGDSERFMAAPIMSAVPHLILKCKVPATETTGAIYTSTARIYRLHLKCRDKTTLDAVSYYYPDAILAQMHAADAAPATSPQQADPIAPTVKPAKLNYRYRIDGPGNIPWRPTLAFDDGARVWVQLPQTTSPMAPVISGDDGTVLNSRMRGRYIVVDSLFNQAQLTSGPDKVTISRSAQ